MFMDAVLFDPDFLQRLQPLKLAFRRRVATEPEGGVLTRRRGQALEFQDHRAYVPGDEFRHIDWNLAGRLDTLFVKQFAREEGRAVILAIDTSPSMAFGTPSKLTAALRAAAALGLLALSGTATVRLVRSARAGAASPPYRGEGMFTALLDDLARDAADAGAATPAPGPGSGQAAQTGSPAAALDRVRRELSGPATVILLSDLWEGEPLEEALRALAASRCEQVVIRFLAPEELAPAMGGKVLLRDSETGRRRRLYVGDEERAAYHRLLEEDQSRWKAFCGGRQIPFLSASSAAPTIELVMVMLREAGVVR